MNTLARIHSPIEVYCLKLDYKCTVKCIGKFVFGVLEFSISSECTFFCWFYTFPYSTVFENHQKCRISSFCILAFSTNFCPIKSDMSGNTV